MTTNASLWARPDAWSGDRANLVGIDPATDLANACRLAHHASDRLRWGRSGWETYGQGQWRLDAAGASAIASRLCVWIAQEVAELRAQNASAAMVERLDAWRIASQSADSIERCLLLARGMLCTVGPPAPGALVEDSPSSIEQVLAAAVYALGRDDGTLRAKDSGRLLTTRLVERIDQLSPRLWPGACVPPLSNDSMARVIGRALGGQVGSLARSRISRAA